MNRMNRRRFVAVTSVTATSVLLVACGNEKLSEEELNPTQIPDVPGAPPTIAPITATPDAAATGDGGGDTGDSGATEAVTIEAHDDFSFSPNEVEVAPGQSVTMTNAGFMQHDLVVDDWGVKTELLNGGDSGEIVVPEDAEIGSSVEFYCSVPGHKEGGMTGTFTVVEAGAAAPAGEEAPAEAGAAGGEVTIEAHDDFSFSPNEADVTPGQTVTVTNAGFMQHDLVVDDWGVKTELLNGGDSGEIIVPEDAEVGSSVEFYCSVPGHKEGGMTGTFTVVEAGAAAPAAPAGEEATAEEGAAEAGAGGSDAVAIEANDDFSFSPNEVEVAPGQSVTVTNAGFMQHDLVVDDWGVKTELLNGGDSGEIVVPEDAEVGSSVEFYCSVPGHKEAGMTGTFTVVEAGAAAAPAGETEDEPAATAEEGAAEAGAGGSGAVAIEANDDFSFSPNEVEVAPGQTVTVTNAGFMQHDLVVDDWGLQTEMLNGGDSGEIVVPEDAEVGSSVEFYCSVPGHKEAGMTGTFTVVEAGAAAPAAPAGEEATAEDGAAEAGAGGSDDVAIEANDDFSFSPSEVEVAPGQTVTVANAGFMQHDLVVDDWGVQTEMLNGGDSGEIVVPEDAEVGSAVVFYCSVPGHKAAGMTGTFTVVEAAAAAAPAGETEDAPAATAEATAAQSDVDAAALTADNNPSAVTVVGTQWQFEPAEFEIAPGGVITFQNETDMMMGLSVEEWNDGTIPVIRSVGAGNSGEFTVPEDAEVGSSIEFTSNLTEATGQGMVGTITIVEGDGAAASPAASPAAESAGSGNAIEIKMLDSFAYEPAEFEASVGDTLHFINEGFMQHDAVVDDWSESPLTELLNGGDTADVVVPDTAVAGEQYEIYCSVPGHKPAGMVATVTIV